MGIKKTDKPRILITGVTSIHGWPIYQRLKQAYPAEQLFAIRPPKMKLPSDARTVAACITDREKLLRIRENFNPTHVVCCSGVCDLDVCEERPEWAHKINTIGAQTVAEIFGKESYLLFTGTDLVYSGNRPPAGGYTEEMDPDPIHVAGRTFAGAEKAVARSARYSIVRLGLPLGDSITGDKGAFDWVRSRFERNLPVTLFTDEFRSAISCEDIACSVLQILQKELEGLFHLGGEEPVSLYQIGRMVLEQGNYPEHLLKGILRSEEKNGPPRIGNVSLNSGKLRGMISACPD